MGTKALCPFTGLFNYLSKAKMQATQFGPNFQYLPHADEKKKRFFVNKIKQMQSLALLGICLSLPSKIRGLKRSGKEDIVALLSLNLANQLRTFDKLLIKTKLSSFT